MRTAGGRRKGWTRIDLVVAIVLGLTVAGVVVAVLLRSREPSHRVECAMHLHHLGVAVHGFHQNRHTLPASCLAPGYATWAVQIAPFLQEGRGKALQPWDLSLPYVDQPPTAREGQVWVYYCPARRQPPQLSISGDVPAGHDGKPQNYPGALGDYGCAPTSNNVAKPWMSPEADGALIIADLLQKQGNKIQRWQARTSLASLSRGQRYTILLGEKHVPLGGFGQVQFGDSSLYNGDQPAAFARLADKQHPLAQGPSDAFNTNFGSWHPGVCQFLMADGSLQVFRNSVDPDLLRQLITRESP
jgi:hypothetical protein